MSKQRRKPQQVDPHEEALALAKWRRMINDCVGYWRICDAGACRRQRGCAGDAIACFEHFWPWTPETTKIRIRATIKALSAGVTSAEELTRVVDAEVERAADHIARVDAETDRMWEAKVAAEKAHARIPFPLEGEGGERSEPGEGFASFNKRPLTPPLRGDPLPQGEREERKSPRVRAL